VWGSVSRKGVNVGCVPFVKSKGKSARRQSPRKEAHTDRRETNTTRAGAMKARRRYNIAYTKGRSRSAKKLLKPSPNPRNTCQTSYLTRSPSPSHLITHTSPSNSFPPICPHASSNRPQALQGTRTTRAYLVDLELGEELLGPIKQEL
jgi:hypothetical protein